jgi:protein-tyrosine phosphatase
MQQHSTVNVLFLCLGNICRSPLAEGVFMHHVRQAGLTHRLAADSAGTGNWHVGELADPRSRAVARRYGLELTHRARQLALHDFAKFHYVVAMDRSNLHNAQTLLLSANGRGVFPQQASSQLVLMRDYDPQATHPDVPDPYTGTDQDFEKVYHMLHRSTQAFMQHLRAQHAL